MIKSFFVSVFFLFISIQIYGGTFLTAKNVAVEASHYKSVKDSIKYLKKTIPDMSNPAEKRSAYSFLGSLQEQAGLYDDAQKSYAAAASINAGDAKEMPKKSTEQLVIDAIRCALSIGDYHSADNYLNTSVKDSKNEKIIAYLKLYKQWSFLCKATSISETSQAIVNLKSYLNMSSMKIVHPQILLTLFHITGDETYANKLKTSYSNTLEAGVVNGSINILPTPFWYFVPRNEYIDKNTSNSSSLTDFKKNDNNVANSNQKRLKQQLGLFRDVENANRLVEKLKENGFVGKIDTEKRPSGTIYYLVYVYENDSKTMGELLRTAGFDCYPLSE